MIHTSINDLLLAALDAVEGDELPAPYCDSKWHQKYQPRENQFCPDCLSPWWATDGSEPYDPALYWLKILARRGIG